MNHPREVADCQPEPPVLIRRPGGADWSSDSFVAQEARRHTEVLNEEI